MVRRDPATCDHRWAAPGAELCPECFASMSEVKAKQGDDTRLRQQERWSHRVIPA